MDVNGTRMHLVLGREDWESVVVPPVDTAACFDVRSHTLGLRPKPFVFPTRPNAERVAPDDRRGVAADRFGNVFWIGTDRTTVLVQGADRTEPFPWWAGHRAEVTPPNGVFAACGPDDLDVLELSGLAVTPHDHLVVGMQRPVDDRSGLLVFDLAGGGPPIALWWPANAAVRPFDLTGLPGGGVAVLDVSDPLTPGSTARLWQLDDGFQVVDLGGVADPVGDAPLFTPLEPGSGPVVGIAPTGTGSVPLHRAGPGRAAVLPLARPTSIDALPDGSVLVLDRQGAEGHFDVSRWSCGVRLPFRVRVDQSDDPAASFVCSDQRAQARDAFAGALGHDLVVVAAPDADVSASTRLFVVDDRGDQAFELLVDETGAELVTDYHPLRLFGGVGLVTAAGVPLFESEGRWFPVPTQFVRRYEPGAVIELAPRLMPHPEAEPPAAGEGGEAVAARGFDAGVPGTTWHRLVLDAVIPPGSSVEIESRAADEPAVLERLAWRAEPAPYLRGDDSEVPHHAYGPGGAGRGSWELLFQGAVGRYLQLRLTLRGDGRQGPRIWAVRAHFPRFSYLAEYLPDIYREDRDSASFLDRYLANVEGTYTTLEGRLMAVQRLVDPTTIDADYLPWLASWVGAAVEPDWEPARVRLFVRHAARMFARRGTPRGMVEAIRLAIHPCPTDSIFDPGNDGDAFDVRIVEAFRTRAVPGVVFGNPGDHAGPRLTPTGERWDLPDGRARLVQRWHAFRAARGASATASEFPVLTPAAPADKGEWHDFVRSQLVPTYADVGSAADLTAFREFLGRRYRSIADYRAAWTPTGTGPSGAGPTSLADVGWPATLPTDGTPLQDWVMFVSAVLPARRSAHRATVLVPIRLGDTDDERARRLGRVRRVVEVESPAHTLVEVQPFWAALRVGEARVGLETIVGEGPRYTDMVLGRGRLAQSVLPGGDTWRLPDRVVVDRDRIKASARKPARTGGTP